MEDKITDLEAQLEELKLEVGRQDRERHGQTLEAAAEIRFNIGLCDDREIETLRLAEYNLSTEQLLTIIDEAEHIAGVLQERREAAARATAPPGPPPKAKYRNADAGQDHQRLDLEASRKALFGPREAWPPLLKMWDSKG